MAGQFTPDDFSESSQVFPAIVSYEFWLRWCGGDGSAIGRSILDEDGRGIRVAGVLPKGFVAPWGHADLLMPLVEDPNSDQRRGGGMVVRLPDGMSADQAAARLSAIDAALAPTWPVSSSSKPTVRFSTYPIAGVSLTPLRSVMTGQTRSTSWLVLTSALALMVLGCLNIAGLAAARVQDRWHDLVLRRALGAGSSDLVRLLAIENAAVVLAGTLVGCLTAAPLLRITLLLLSDPTQFLKLPSVDARVLAFSAAASLGCVTLITTLAARAIIRTNTRATLADGPTVTRRRRRSSWSIVSAQVAVALVLAVGGSLVAGSLMRAWVEKPGFNLERTVVVRMTPVPGTTADAIETLMTDLRRLPSIIRAGGVAWGFLDGSSWWEGTGDFDPPERIPPPSPGVGPGTVGVVAARIAVTNGYLEAAGLEVKDGRLPTQAEFESGAPVLVVSESVAKGYWPTQRAVGQTLFSNEGLSSPRRQFTVIGEVSDARYAALDRDPYGALYYPNAADGHPDLANVVLELSKDNPPSSATIEGWIRQRCPRCSVYGAQKLTDLTSTSILPREFDAWLFASFGFASVTVVGVGILGLVAMTASRRRKEIGIRLTLGATSATVTGQLLREQVAAVVVGLMVGGLIAAWAVQFLKSYLYKLPLYDPRAWGAAIFTLVVVAVIGTLVPTARASHIDPVRALRIE